MHKKTLRSYEIDNHIKALDSTIPTDAKLYRFLMSKDEESGQVSNQSYSAGEDPSLVIDSLNPTHHQYITPALFNSKKSRTKRSLVATSALYVDLDDALADIDGGRIGLDLINYAINKSKLPEPSLIIYTGGGWHLYWLFSELYYFNSQDDIDLYEDTISNIIESLAIIGADPRAKDATRLLRLAGTFNPKEDYASNTRVLLIENRTSTYTLADFSNIKKVKTLPDVYKPKAINTLTDDEDSKPKSIKAKSKPKKPKYYKRPNQFPINTLEDIIKDSQANLEVKSQSAQYLKDKNRDLLIDLLVNFVNLPRNIYRFEDGSTGQYVQEGFRNNFIWSLSRRGVSPYYLRIINQTLILPSLAPSEFDNAIKLGSFNVPRISSTIQALNLTLEEQSKMIALREDYEALLGKHQSTIQARINQTISESSQHIVILNPNKSTRELSEELGLTTRHINRIKKSGEVNSYMSRAERIKELNEIKLDIARIKETSVKELLASYKVVDEEMGKIIETQGLIHTFGVQLSLEEKAEIQARIRSISDKVAFIQTQLEHYEAFIMDDSEFFKSGKIKKTVLLDKMKRLKESADLVLA